MAYTSGAIDIGEYLRENIRVPSTSGSAIYPSTDTNLVSSVISYKNTLEPEDDKREKLDEIAVGY